MRGRGGLRRGGGRRRRRRSRSRRRRGDIAGRLAPLGRSRAAARLRFHGQHAEHGQAGGRPEQPAGDGPHRVRPRGSECGRSCGARSSRRCLRRARCRLPDSASRPPRERAGGCARAPGETNGNLRGRSTRVIGRKSRGEASPRDLTEGTNWLGFLIIFLAVRLQLGTQEILFGAGSVGASTPGL